MTNLTGPNLNRREAAGPKGEGKESPSTFPAYPEYKDSGVEWLGEVPAHWEVLPLKARFQVVGGSTPSADEEHWGGQITWVTPADLSSLPSLKVGTSARQITQKGLDSCGATMVPPGSLVLSTRAPIGSLAIASVPLSTNQGCKSLVPDKEKDSRFFAYLLKNSTEALNVRGKGTTFLELSGDELSSFKVTVPPQDEQSNVAHFLDHETARIDALVEEQQRLIELLKEKRQAVISHAVTKGLDPDVPMKDSGVEWLGKVPAHWEVFPIKRDLEFLTSGSRGWASHYSDNGAAFIRIGNLTRDHINLDLTDLQRVSVPKGSEGERTKVKENDVLFSITAYLGSVAVVPEELETAYVSQHVALVRLFKKKLLPSWVAYVTLSDVGKNYLSSQGYGGTKIQLSLEDVAELLVTAPPLDEQAAIISFLDHETARIDALAEEGDSVITLLQERRSALISAAVTGKIDVRGWTPPADTAPADRETRMETV